MLWESVYLSNNSSSTGPDETQPNAEKIQPNLEMEQAGGSLQKTRSCENLLVASQEQISTNTSRRRSDPNITLDIPNQNHIIKDGERNCSTNNIPNGIPRSGELEGRELEVSEKEGPRF